MDEAASRTTRTSWVRQRGDLLAVLALIIASFVFVADQVAEHEMLSPIDEYQYVGYYAVVADEGVVRQGSKMPFYARKYMMCHGVRSVVGMEQNPAGCEKPNSVEYVIAGGTTADLYAPFYFITTRVMAQPFIWAGVDFVDAGRMAGGFWLSLGAVFLFLTLRRARVPVTVALGLGLVLVGSLPAYWGTTYISTDATALASGSIAAWLTLRALDGKRWTLLILPAVATFATLCKLQNLIAFGAAALVLLVAAGLAAGKEHRQPGARAKAFLLDRRTLSAVVTVVVPVLAQAAWLAIRSALAVGPSPTLGVPIPLVFDNLVVETANFFPAIARGAMDPLATGPESLLLFLVGTALAIGGAAGLAMSKGVTAQHRVIGFSTVLVTVLAAPALAIVLGAVSGLYTPFPSRYGNSMFPWALICAGLLMDTERRWARYLLLALGAVTWALSLTLGEV
jgi:hypothetical protein